MRLGCKKDAPLVCLTIEALARQNHDAAYFRMPSLLIAPPHLHAMNETQIECARVWH